LRILEHTIDLPSWETEFRIIPFGCVHADTEGFAETLWRECLDEIKKPHTYAIGAGDYLDAVRTHARININEYRGRGEDEQTPDKWAQRAYTDFYRRWLKPIESKIILIGKGNHLWDFACGKTSDMLLSELTGAPYGDKPTFLRLRVRIHGRIQKTFKVLVHHEGGGGGGYARHGTDVNAAETKMYQFGAFDIVIFSHTHRKWGLTIPDLDLPHTGALRLHERTRALIRTGCFTRSYDVKCMSHYAHRKLLPPTELGYVTLKIKLSKGPDDVPYYRMKLEL
jgi:hypothetical protein